MPIRFVHGMILSVLVALSMTGAAMSQPLNDRINAAYDAGDLPGLHGALIRLGTDTLAETYFSGADEKWGQSLGIREHDASSLHDLRSVTKSIVGLLYGIALSEQKVPGLDAPLYAQFPQYPDLQQEPGRDRILVRHALTMQMGLEWNEDLPYSDPRNSEIAMERAPDRYRYVLEQPIREAPGTSWIYGGGAVALIAKLIADGTGMPIDAYAKTRLFDPLGIDRFEWTAGADGIPSAASGLRLTLPDLAKIGELIANDGAYNGQQIIPEDWLKASFVSHANVNDFTRYGLLWYLAGSEETPVVIAVGNGGQRLTVQPNVDLVVAAFVGRYNDPDSWQTSLKIVLDFAVPEAKRRLGK